MKILIKKILQKIGLNKLIRRLGLNKILFGGTAFHRDRMMRRIILEIINFFSPTAFVETGTYKGGGLYFIAKHTYNLPLFSCEIKKEFFEEATRFLKKFPNVKIFNQSSEDFLNQLQVSDFGECPLFYLDAHGHGCEYLPLKNEVRIITSKCDRAIIIIDDFQVPDREEFAYIVEKNQVCNFNLVKPSLKPGADYSILYPAYSQKDSGSLTLIGYGIIFKNLNSQFSKFIKIPWVSENFQIYADRN
jgi:hypothetical protein